MEVDEQGAYTRGPNVLKFLVACRQSGLKKAFCRVVDGALNVEQDIRRPFRWEIKRICFADIGQVKVWNGRTVGAAGTVKAAGSCGLL